ncbi:porin PorA family protein [Corynebacterium cystitidis]|uniref:DUF3068 domain-containing protein n=1 Tax=Corynebacterium cystitidis DSM 20524 TaxID=1121357 RepID=A0A1H9T9A5_9CORY|nr:porin PorA family protein [Corynebacterium cystitidis]WJY83502.1 hypothetical protein CCYS_13090 [Corynebacterium cystitidis DSM 20524]SER93524.1 Protein of unknown function [Corynebacterium cystitidis DSM 20524]SNV92447.1 putative integral membrane protein [Corynebacterium cystitidis]
MAVFDRARNKRGIILAASVAVVAIVIGNLVPPIAVFFMKLLPHGAQTNVRLVSEESVVLNLRPELDPELDPVDNPSVRCVDLGVPGCTHLHAPAELTQVITTSSTDTFLETNVDSLLRLKIGGELYAKVEDHHRLNRDSAYPVREPVAAKLFTIGPLNTRVEVPPHTLEGLRYFFPFETERRSYQYADPVVRNIVPLDYVNPTEVNGVRTYEFHTDIPVTNLVKAALAGQPEVLSLEQQEAFAALDSTAQIQVALGLDEATMEGVAAVTEGPAQRFFSPAEMERFGYAEGQKVALQPYYDAERTFFIEPKTGTVLNQKVAVNIFLAENNVQAQEISDEGLNNPARTVLRADFEFDEATRQAQTETATPQIKQIRVLQVVSWLANVTTILALAVLAWLILRRRKHSANISK